jgi:NAD(P)H-flavin reductase
MEFTVISISDIGSVRILRMDPHDAKLDFKAGHYAVLQFGDYPARPYSIASTPSVDYLEFHIKISDTGAGAIVSNIKLGDTILCHGFGGNYHHQSDCTLPLLLVGGGTGLAPLMSIATERLQKNPDHPIHLYHGGRYIPDLYLDKTLRDMAERFPNFSYVPVLSDYKDDDKLYGYAGDLALTFVPQPYRLYVAGPVEMIRGAVNQALNMGISPDLIHSDLDDLDSLK